MSNLKDIAERYIALWNEADTDKRAAAIAELFTADAPYTDPLAAVEGHEGIAAVIDGVRAQFSGYSLELVGPVDGHHHIARFQWGLFAEPGAEPVVIGFDVVVVDDEGRVTAVHGFLDKVPAGA